MTLRELTPEESAILASILKHRQTPSPATLAMELDLPVNHVMIALRSLREMGRIHGTQWW
jgi:hypothetical protein